MSEVKWIKIKTDIFDNEKFRIIDTMPMADTIEVIWFKLLVFAGRSNNNGIFMFNDKIAYTDEMLAKIFGRDLDTVRLALQTFIKLDMVEEMDGVYSIKNWEKHQPQLEQLKDEGEKAERKRKYNRERMRKIRACGSVVDNKDNLLSECCSDVVDNIDNTTSYSYSISNSNSFNNNKELVDNNNKNDKCNSDNSNTKTYKESINTIIEYLNIRAGTNYKPTTKKTQTLIIARMKEGNTVDDFKTVIDKKCNEWMGTEHEKYLRPETLFGTKFEGYLNQHIIVDKPTNKGEIDWANI